MTISPAVRELVLKQIHRPGTHVTTIVDRFGVTRNDALDLARLEGFGVDDQDRLVREHPALLAPVPPLPAPEPPRAIVEVALPEYNEPSPSTITAPGVDVQVLADFAPPQPSSVYVLRPSVVDLLTEAGNSTNPTITELLHTAELALDALNAAVLHDRETEPLRRRRAELLAELADLDTQLGITFDQQNPAELDDTPAREFTRVQPDDPGYAAAVREWCHYHAIDVSTHGRVNNSAMQAYEDWWTL